MPTPTNRCDRDAPCDPRVDPHVARAVAAMKADPARRWTVKSLARVGGLSRAAFARRFSRTVGVGPFRWLTEHRLHLANANSDPYPTSAAIAAEVGYGSEFAFAKAFKRRFGVAPGRFRRLLDGRRRIEIGGGPVRAAA